MTGNGWDVSKQYVMKSLERIEAKLDKNDEAHLEIKTAIAGLKVRSGMWGAIAGLLPALGAALWLLLKG